MRVLSNEYKFSGWDIVSSRASFSKRRVATSDNFSEWILVSMNYVTITLLCKYPMVTLMV